jgi:hypothetical protein
VVIGVQFICTGILTEMLARTYFEAGTARTYLVRDTLGTLGAIDGADGAGRRSEQAGLAGQGGPVRPGGSGGSAGAGSRPAAEDA